MRVAKFEDVEELLFEWFKHVLSDNVAISGVLLQEKAVDIAQEFGIDSFKNSNGWLGNFLTRYSSTFIPNDFGGGNYRQNHWG